MRRTLVPLVIAVLVSIAAPAAGDLTDTRARPEPGQEECGGDRLVGTWRAQRYDGGWHNIRTLQLRRAGGEAIEGRIIGLWWEGDRTMRRPPPPCVDGFSAYRVTEPSRGVVRGGDRISFRAESYRIDSTICGYPPSSYNLDHFTGTLDASRPLLRAVNNDGRAAQNDEYLFRRVSCR